MNINKIKKIASIKIFANHSPVGCACCLERNIAVGVLKLVEEYKYTTEKEVIDHVKKNFDIFGDTSPSINTGLFFKTI